MEPFASVALSRFVPEHLRRRLIERPEFGGQAAAQHFDPSAVLFADISGFTRLMIRETARGRAGVEELTRHLNAYFGQMIETVTSHGGDVVNFAGDGMLAIWAPANSGERDARLLAARAAVCGATLQKLLHKREISSDTQLTMTIAIGAGRASLVQLGGMLDRWLFVVGGEPNVQLREASGHGVPGTVVLSKEAWALLQGAATGQTLPGGEGILNEVVERINFEPLQIVPVGPDAMTALRRFVPGAVLSRVGAGQTRWLGELRQVTSLFAQLPPIDFEDEDALERAQELLRDLQRIIYRYEGSVDKVIDDDKGLVLMAGWGLPPLAHEDDALRAIEAGCEIRDLIRSRGHFTSLGVATGQVYCGAIGNATRTAYTIMGAPVNLAARLMQETVPDVLCDQPTRDACARQIAFESTDQVVVKGIKGTSVFYEPKGELEEQVERAQVPLVGRHRERDLIGKGIRELSGDRRGSTVLLVADAGVGKSRLLAEATRMADEAGVRCLRGAGDSITRESPYHAMAPMAADLLGIRQVAPGADVDEHILSQLSDDPDLVTRAPLLNDLLNSSLPENDLTRSLGAEVRADNLHKLVARLLVRAALARPVAVFAEDVHWFDSASLAMLKVLVRNAPSVLFMLSSRPPEESRQDYEDIVADPTTIFMPLEALSDGETIDLVCLRLGVESLPDALAGLIRRKGEGNSFYSEELALALRDAGHIEVREGRCRIATADQQLDDTLLPTTVQGVVTSRIDRLPPQEQLLLKVASVLGRSFDLDVLSDVMPRAADRSNHGRLIEALTGLDIIRPTVEDDEATIYEFRHIIAREAIYDLMLQSQRRELHGTVAAWHETHHADELDNYHGLLAHHWTEAENWRKAVQYLGLAGGQALQRSANAECVRFLGRALVHSRKTGVRVSTFRRGAWWADIAEAHFRLGNQDDSRTAAWRALSDLGYPLATTLPGQLLGLLKQVALRFVPWDRSRQAHGLAEDERLRRRRAMELRNRLTEIAGYKNDAMGFLYCGLAELNLAETLGPSVELGRAYAMMSIVLGALPMHSVCQRWADQAMELAQEHDRPLVEAYLLSRVGVSRLYQSAWQVAESGTRRARDICVQRGDVRLLEEVLAVLSQVLTYQGRLAEVSDLSAHLDEVSKESGNLQGRAWYVLFRGLYLARAGLAREAVHLFEEAVPWLESQASNAEYIWGQGVRALVLLWAGQREAAREVADATMARIRKERPVAYWQCIGVFTVCEVYLELWREARESGGGQEKALGKLYADAVGAMVRFGRIFPFGRPYAVFFKALLAQERGQTDKGAALLDDTMAEAEEKSERWLQMECHAAMADSARDDAKAHRQRAAELQAELALLPMSILRGDQSEAPGALGIAAPTPHPAAPTR